MATDLQAETYIRLLYGLNEDCRVVSVERGNDSVALIVEEVNGWRCGYSCSEEMIDNAIVPDYPDATWKRFNAAGWANDHSAAYYGLQG